MRAVGRRQWIAGLAGLSLVDMACRRPRAFNVDRAARPTRIVSLSPNTTETLFALGAGDRVVGRSRYCDHPPEAARIPAVGGYVDVSFEAILALHPDLVVGARGPAGSALTDHLASLGIATYFPRTESMAEIDAMITELAAKVGAAPRGAELLASVRERRAAVSRAVAGQPRVRTLLVFGLTPIVVAGPGGFPHEMLGLVSAENVITAGGPYPTVGIEHLLALDPEIIVNAASAEAHGGQGAGINMDAPGFRDLKAVQRGRVSLLDDEAALRPGPRIGDGLAALARAVHPGVEIP